MSESPTRYKVLVDGKAAHGGTFTYDLPTPWENDEATVGGWTPGAWTEPIKRVSVCDSGYHLTTQPEKWLKVGCAIYEAEGTGSHDSAEDKTAFASVRLLRPAPEALPAYWPKVEQFVRDLPTLSWNKPDGNPDPAWRLFTAPTLAAARDAARVAARVAALDAALDAARDAALDAARVAALDAALDAARVAALDAALDAARVAALDAARDAALDAARDAALDAARDAARDAALDAARDAALDAARVAALDAALAAARDAADKAAFLTVEDLIDPAHTATIAQRWEVWTKGYCLFVEVDGVLFVYSQDQSRPVTIPTYTEDAGQ